MQQKFVFLAVLVLFFAGCYTNVDYEHEIKFQLQDSFVHYQTNIEVVVTTDDITKALDESGYSIDSFDSLVIDSATLSPDSERPFEVGELTSLEFIISDDSSSTSLLISSPGLPNHFGFDSIYCDFDEDILLDYYKHSPFVLNGNFAGNSTQGGLFVLKISGYIKLSLY